MTKKTIKDFERELQTARDEASRWYQKSSRLEEEQKNKTSQIITRLEKENSNLVDQVRNLLEIIRWEINPDTAKLPFTIAKSERDNNSFNRY